MFPFMKLKWAALALSILLISGSYYVTFYVLQGFTKGMDFSGGIKLEVELNDKVSIDSIRNFFKSQGLNALVQKAGKENHELAKIELGSKEEKTLQDLASKNIIELEAAKLSENSVDYLKLLMRKELSPEDSEKINFVGVDQVGPTIGKYLTESATKLLLVTLLLITVYITFRFKFRFAIGAMVALLHDLFLTLGVIGFFEIPLSIPVVAALLTILGYSINDTIVIFDRIRENLSTEDNYSIETVVNQSINESLTRTIITSLTTLVAVIAVYFLAQDSLREMALVLIIGIVIGTYSSSFVASPVIVLLEKYSKK
ncbi:MAG: protein translocase subunit SecF [Spirochaetia bacterium]|nr:protein translocase subunit SecF [Spirochaetia bacterium]